MLEHPPVNDRGGNRVENWQSWMVDPPAWTCIVAILLCGIIVGMVMKR